MVSFLRKIISRHSGISTRRQFTPVVYWFQLRAMRKSLQQTLIMQRRELYTGMTTSLDG